MWGDPDPIQIMGSRYPIRGISKPARSAKPEGAGVIGKTVYHMVSYSEIGNLHG